MTLNEVAANLQHFNDWRRGHHDEQPDQRVIGEAIDAAVEMIDRLEAAEKLNEKLREALAEKVASETMLRDLSVGNGHINASFEGGAVHLLVDALANQFVESSATNYLEMQFHSNVTGPLVVTLQRLNGRTPHQLRAEAEKERDALRAKIAEMERQEPIGEIVAFGEFLHEPSWKRGALPHLGTKLYALPGAQQPAPSVPDGWLHHAARMAALARKLREPDWHFESVREMQRELCALEDAALAAAPEAKP